MKRNCSFRVLKNPLNLKFYDSDETITLPENKIHTWLRSQQSLASATGCPGRQNTSGPCSWRVQPKTRQELAAQTKVVTSKRFVQSAYGGCVTPDNVTGCKSSALNLKQDIAFISYPVSPVFLLFDTGYTSKMVRLGFLLPLK